MSKQNRATQEHATTSSARPSGWQWATAAAGAGAGVAYLAFDLPSQGIAVDILVSTAAGAWLTGFTVKAVRDFLRETTPAALAEQAGPVVVRVFAGRNPEAAAPALTCENEDVSDRRRPSPGRSRDRAAVFSVAAVPGE